MQLEGGSGDITMKDYKRNGSSEYPRRDSQPGGSGKKINSSEVRKENVLALESPGISDSRVREIDLSVSHKARECRRANSIIATKRVSALDTDSENQYKDLADKDALAKIGAKFVTKLNNK